MPAYIVSEACSSVLSFYVHELRAADNHTDIRMLPIGQSITISKTSGKQKAIENRSPFAGNCTDSTLYIMKYSLHAPRQNESSVFAIFQKLKGNVHDPDSFLR